MNSAKTKANLNLKTMLPALAAIGMIAALAGCAQRKAAQAAPPPPPEVAVIEVKTEKTVLTTELPGRVNALLVAEVRPQIGGIIQKRFFEEGADVKEGDILYQIDSSLYKAAYDKAVADLAKAEARIISIRKNFERYKKLVETSAVSQQDYDNSESELNTAAADILSYKAAVETAWINLEHTKILAPISGRIGKSNITVGALVAPNHATALATIQQIDPIYVDVTQSNASLLRLKNEIAKGLIKFADDMRTNVKLVLEDGSVYSHRGALQFRDITVDQSTGTFILRIVFQNPDKVLLPGMFVQAVLETGVIEQAILVPQQAVARDPKGRPVAIVVSKEGKAEQRLLEIGQAVGSKWIVTGGLASGDRVVVEGIQKARPGTDVKAIPFVEASSEKASAEPSAQVAANAKK